MILQGRRGKLRVRKLVGQFLSADWLTQNNIIVYNNSISNLWRGLMERLYYVKGNGGFVECPRPVQGIFASLRSFRHQVLRYMPKHATPMTADEFVATYVGSKRKRYEKARDTLLSRPLRSSDGHVSTFIKAELYNCTNKPNPAPRLIQPRTPEYLLETGRYLKVLEKRIYKAIDRVFGYHAVLKCDNPLKRARTIQEHWACFHEPCFVGMDASRFDQHVSADALKWEHGFYLQPFDNDRYLQKLLAWQIQNVGYARADEGFIRYAVEGCRMSGDMNTALGNVILMCGITKHYLDTMGVPYRFIDDGDDCGVIMERRNLHLLDDLPRHHLQYGFEMEVEQAVFRIEEIEFCQCKPIQIGPEEYVMIRNIHKALHHDRIHIDKDWARVGDLQQAISVCGLSLNKGIPIVDALYTSMATCAREKAVNRLIHERHGDFYHCGGSQTLDKFVVDTDAARVSVYYAFGITPDMQICMEDDIRAADYMHTTFEQNYRTSTSQRRANNLQNG
jgi:hypothetical protein